MDEILVANDVSAARYWGARFRGLMFKKAIDDQQGLLIPFCNWIHTFFMNFPIDVIYLASDYRIVDISSDVKPWRLCKPRFKAAHVLELRSGMINRNRLFVGEVVRCIA